ncbi:MAG: hypothetical protein IPI42_14650 [Saprospiraceae bacterium]|nr:hypothetical protein [Candidatus Parvibacillus calidus]
MVTWAINVRELGWRVISPYLPLLISGGYAGVCKEDWSTGLRAFRQEDSETVP